jgi:hypothetical protein
MNNNLINQVVYTNSNCKDVWDMFIKQYEKHTKSKLFVITNTDDFPITNKERIFTYSNNDSYYETWINALESFNIENFIYLQEDFILYDNVDDEKIFELSNILNNSKHSFLRLIKSGNLGNSYYANNIFEIEPCNENIFSMQATIWKTKDYIDILYNVKESKWLETINYRNYMCSNNISGLYYYQGEFKRGGNHYDSSIYPYIATALVKGKWNTLEYGEELSSMFNDYHINPIIRGVI